MAAQQMTGYSMEPNLIKVAVAAAGGRLEAARKMGESAWTITHWQRTARVPADRVRALAAISGGVVTVDALLGYIERNKAPEKAAA